MSTNDHASPSAEELAEFAAFREWKRQHKDPLSVEVKTEIAPSAAPTPAPHVDAATHRHGTGAPQCVACGGPLNAGGVTCANHGHPQGARAGANAPAPSAPPPFDPAHAREDIGRPAPPPPAARVEAPRVATRRTHAAPPGEPWHQPPPVVVVDLPPAAEEQETPPPNPFAEFTDPARVAKMSESRIKTMVEIVNNPASKVVARKLLELIIGG